MAQLIKNISLRGLVAFWVAGLLFVFVGFIFGLVVPAVAPDADMTMLFVFKILGFVFGLLGCSIIGLMIVALIIRSKSPQNVETFYWWINFVGGILGASIFALPSFFCLPIIFIFYGQRPNFFFPDDRDIAFKFLIGAIFTLVGLGVSIGTYFIARSYLRNCPRWKSCRKGS